MAKRSPILGYNHNVRYRGLVWHVQTEDSGLANPHLFTHLFHEGVIVSTRKLVYDSGSDEGAIKSLMQAQHKAVMKDLKRGHFDDKIDLYLAGTPGLLPRGGVEDGAVEAEPAKPEAKAKPVPPPPVAADDLDPPTQRTDVPLAMSAPRVNTKPGTQPAVARTGSPQSAQAAILALELDPPDVSGRSQTEADSSPEIQLELGGDESGPALMVEADEPPDADRVEPSGRRRRSTHDTEISISDVPGIVIDDATRKNDVPDAAMLRPGGDSIPPLPPPPIPASVERRNPTGDRPAVGAATLPPARAITRPPTSRPAAISPPTVSSRPITAEAGRTRAESDAVEVYSPPPPSVEPPPGAAGERPGQYAQHRRSSAIAVPTDVIQRPPPIPAGLGKRTAPTTGQPPARQSSDRIPTLPLAPPVPQAVRSEPTSGSMRARTPTPARIPSAPSRPNASGSGGVVMTRPAVIVGAPAKPATPQRVRKAREDEGRGFGQGLISEKSLDEVILAYLSEDADEK